MVGSGSGIRDKPSRIRNTVLDIESYLKIVGIKLYRVLLSVRKQYNMMLPLVISVAVSGRLLFFFYIPDPESHSESNGR
jgi:hypothetical protein